MLAVKRFSRVAVLAATVFAGGCDSGSEPPVAPPARKPAALVAVNATALTAAVGGPVQDSVRVRVLDQHGVALAGVDVEFRVLSGNGAIAPGRVSTRSDGTAAAAWTLGTQAGEQVAAAFVAALPPVSFTATATPGPAAEVTVSPAVATLAIGDSVHMTAAVRDGFGNVLHDAAVQWSSSGPAVAAVSAAGTVTALAEGSVEIVARAGSVTGVAQLVVSRQRSVVASAHISPDSLLLVKGDTATLSVVVRDSAGNVLAGRGVDWSSSNTAVAAVDASGRVIAREPGTATITAHSEGRSATAAVRVVHAAAVTGSRLRLAAGQEHSCALNGAGAAFCWGANWGGQLGNGSTIDPGLLPVPVSGAHTFTALAAGSGHTCALTGDGAVYCWGDNTYGQLGTGSTAASRVPARVAAPNGAVFVSLAAGDYHSCALTATGAAWCWGSQLAGELGIGAVVPDQCAVSGVVLPCSTRPVAVSGSRTWVRITAGHLFTCAIAADGSAWCWGMNSAGNLGTGDLQNRTVPSAVSAGPPLAAISAGAFHTCAVSVTGDALCWGLAEQGQLGVGGVTPGSCAAAAGSFPCVTTPAAVAGGLDVRQLAAGFYHTCAVTTVGSVFCWGLNQGGQLAVPATGPEQCPTVAGPLPCSRVPLAASAAAVSGDVVAGGYHSLRGFPDATWAWGANWYGQLGTGDTTDRALPFRVVF
jgi:alpha-tubulin suppressor-like RCC1 family protein